MITVKLYGIWKRLLAQCLTDAGYTRSRALTPLTPAYTVGDKS